MLWHQGICRNLHIGSNIKAMASLTLWYVQNHYINYTDIQIVSMTETIWECTSCDLIQLPSTTTTEISIVKKEEGSNTLFLQNIHIHRDLEGDTFAKKCYLNVLRFYWLSAVNNVNSPTLASFVTIIKRRNDQQHIKW